MPMLRKCLYVLALVMGVLGSTAVIAARATKDDVKSSRDMAAELATLRADVADLRDRQKIKEVYVNYGRGIDRLDEQSYRKAFWPDARIGYGTDESHQYGTPSTLTPEEHWSIHMMKWHKQGLKSWGHFMGNESIDIDHDTAHVEIYVIAMPMSKDEKPGIMWAGRYVDRLTKKNGEWRIAAREFVPYFAMKTTDKLYSFLDGYKSGDPACVGDAWSWQGRQDVRYVRPLPARTSKEAGTPCAK